MKKMKNFLAVLLLFCMALSVMACGGAKNGQDSTTEPSGTSEASKDDTGGSSEEGAKDNLADIIPKDTITLDVYTQLANYSGEQIGWFGQVIKEKFNVKLNIINEGEGTFATRMESGNLGDIIIFGSDSDEYIQAIENGMLFDWNEDNLLDEYGPYIKEHMAKALEKNASISPDGKMHGFGHDVGTSASDHAVFFYKPDIRWDLYKKLGYPEINTLEDFIDVLEKMVELEPTSDTSGKTYAVSMFPDWDGDMVMIVKSTAALYGYDEFGFGLYNVMTQEYEDCLRENSIYLRCLKFYNELYQRGLLDPDSMTQTYDEMIEDYQTGAAFFNIFDWMASGVYNTPDHLAEGKAMLPLAANDQKNIVYGLNIYGGNRIWTIGANTEYPELCMAIINWLATPEGSLTMNLGPKGAVWDYDDQGRPYLTDLGKACVSDLNTEMTNGYSGTYNDGKCQINNTTWALSSVNFDAANGDRYDYKTWETYLENLQISDVEQDWRNFTGALSADEYLEKNGHIAVAVGTQYTPTPKSDELQTIWSQVAETIKTYSWRAIYANSDEEFNSIVEEMRTKAKEYGYDQCVEYQQNEANIRKELENAAKAASNN